MLINAVKPQDLEILHHVISVCFLSYVHCWPSFLSPKFCRPSGHPLHSDYLCPPLCVSVLVLVFQKFLPFSTPLVHPVCYHTPDAPLLLLNCSVMVFTLTLYCHSALVKPASKESVKEPEKKATVKHSGAEQRTSHLSQAHLLAGAVKRRRYGVIVWTHNTRCEHNFHLLVSD